MVRNKYNSLIGIGNNKGVVSLYSPNSASAIIKILAHSGTVNGLDITTDGRYITTIGSEG